jgi:hypothetical protein
VANNAAGAFVLTLPVAVNAVNDPGYLTRMLTNAGGVTVPNYLLPVFGVNGAQPAIKLWLADKEKLLGYGLQDQIIEVANKI